MQHFFTEYNTHGIATINQNTKAFCSKNNNTTLTSTLLACECKIVLRRYHSWCIDMHCSNVRPACHIDVCFNLLEYNGLYTPLVYVTRFGNTNYFDITNEILNNIDTRMHYPNMVIE